MIYTTLGLVVFSIFTRLEVRSLRRRVTQLEMKETAALKKQIAELEAIRDGRIAN